MIVAYPVVAMVWSKAAKNVTMATTITAMIVATIVSDQRVVMVYFTSVRKPVMTGMTLRRMAVATIVP